MGYLSFVLHAHLPFVRHPEHATFLEENWFYEAITESYLPLLQMMEGWVRDGVRGRLTMTLSPTLCSMLLDPLLQGRYLQYLDSIIDLAEKETHRTLWDARLNPLAQEYFDRFRTLRVAYLAYDRNLVGAFRRFQESGILEIITTAATHAVLPLLDRRSMRAQVLAARDHYRECFDCDPKGIWLPECAYTGVVDDVLSEAKLLWFIVDGHGVLHAEPRPRYGTFAPLITPAGVAAFGRDHESAAQVWSREEGYPGDPRYRDFYRDIGFDLDLDYLKPHLPAPPARSFTGIKYFAITGATRHKQPYDRRAAIHAAGDHAAHFLRSRIEQISKIAAIMDRPPIVVAPYDAELFGHWWYEGPEFLDFVVRKIVYDQHVVELITPTEYLNQSAPLQVAKPSPSTWGEQGHLKVWLNEANEWMYPHLIIAQERMSHLALDFRDADAETEAALKQAARELLLAQSSDWAFILRTGSSPEYARKRFNMHVLRFLKLHDMIRSRRIDREWLRKVESQDNLFSNLDYRYWA